MIRTILVAVDGSPRSRGVFVASAEIARATRAHTILFRAVVVPPDFAPAAATLRADPLPPFLMNQARIELLDLMAIVPDMSCTPRIEHAIQPWRGILAAADAVDADLIVLGSHGYGGWDHVLGTTAGKVANLAKRSVLVVHDRAASVEGEAKVGRAHGLGAEEGE